MPLDSQSLVINKLGIRGTFAEDFSVGRRVGAVFSTVDLDRSLKSPSAILCIRKLSDPVPQGLRLHVGRYGHSAWKDAFNAELRRIAARAARPAMGPVPPAAEAVFFADRAELLASLAADWCDGSAVARWWWQSLFRSTDVASAVIREWLHSIESVPAAIVYLAKRGLSIPVVRAIGEPQVRALLLGLIERFALAELVGLNDATRVEEPVTGEFADDLDTPARAAKPASSNRVSTHSQQIPFSPWASQVLDPSLTINQQYLLGIGLMLHRASFVVQSQSFSRTLRQWLETARVSTLVDSSEVSLLNSETDHLPESQTSWELRPHSPREALPREGASRVTSETSNQAILQSLSKSRGTTAAPNEYPFESQSCTDVCIETSYGGVFYLINVGLFLGLYGDFTNPLRPGIALSIWDFVSLIGRELIGLPFESDPLWPVLAQLAGRDSHDLPGKNFESPESWRLPVEWLAPFHEDANWRWEICGGRLQIRHPAGFLVVDLPVGDDPLEQIEKETRVFQPVKISRGPVQFSASVEIQRYDVSIERWLNWLLPFLRSRLRRALRLIDGQNLSSLLCEQNARVHLTATHLEIFFSLAELPITIRLAGLDRDPGWVPAAGRYVRFHFE